MANEGEDLPPSYADSGYYGYGFVGMGLTDAEFPTDTNSLTDCSLDRVTLVCAGQAPGRIEGCDFYDTRLLFTGAAADVVRCLRALHHGTREQSDRLRELLDVLRRGADFKVAARLASWEHLRSTAAVVVLQLLRDVARSGQSGRALFETFVADLRAKDSQLIGAQDLTPAESSDPSVDGTLTGRPGKRLRLRISHPEWADADEVSTGIAELVRALDVYHRANGGAGLEVDDTPGTKRTAVASEVLV